LPQRHRHRNGWRPFVRALRVPYSTVSISFGIGEVVRFFTCGSPLTLHTDYMATEQPLLAMITELVRDGRQMGPRSYVRILVKRTCDHREVARHPRDEDGE
jgi:hypothetical protein